jgi:acetolactate synthase-1/2/3 large subunit
VSAAAAALLGGGDTLLLLGGHALREGPLARAGRIAARTGCALMSEFAAARVQRGAGRVAALRVPYVVEAAQAALARFRRIVLVGATPPVAFFAYPDKPSLLAAAGCEFVTLAEVDEDLDGALAALAERVGAAGVAPTGLAQARTVARADLPQGKVSSEGVAVILSSLMPENAIVVDESVTFGRAFSAATAGAPPHDWLTGTGGSIGFAMPVAVGAAIAAPDRRVVVLEGDGSGRYTLQALWTMAREKLDVTVVLFANRDYAILQLEFQRVGASGMGERARNMMHIGNPDIDFVALAGSMGVPAERAEDAAAFSRAFAAAMAERGPRLIEVTMGSLLPR